MNIKTFHKIISVFLVCIALFSVLSVVVFANNEHNLQKGDVDFDGAVSLSDAVKIMRYLADKVSFDEDELYAADIDWDGKITIRDILWIMKCLADKITIYEFPEQPGATQELIDFAAGMNERLYGWDNDFELICIARDHSIIYVYNLKTELTDNQIEKIQKCISVIKELLIYKDNFLQNALQADFDFSSLVFEIKDTSKKVVFFDEIKTEDFPSIEIGATQALIDYAERNNDNYYQINKTEVNYSVARGYSIIQVTKHTKIFSETEIANAEIVSAEFKEILYRDNYLQEIQIAIPECISVIFEAKDLDGKIISFEIK